MPDYSKYITFIKSLSPHTRSVEAGAVFGSNSPVLSRCLEPFSNVTYCLSIKGSCQMDRVVPNKDSVSTQNTCIDNLLWIKNGAMCPAPKSSYEKQTQTPERFLKTC